MKAAQHILRPQLRALPQSFRGVEIVAPVALPAIPVLVTEVTKSESSEALYWGINGFSATRPTFEIAHNYLVSTPSIRHFSTSSSSSDPLRAIIGTNDFKKLRFLGEDSFVDKSGFIEAFENNGHEVCLNTFPRRFLKTTNLNSLECFYTIEVDEKGEPLPLEERKNTALFTGGEISYRGTSKFVEPLKVAASPIMCRLGTAPVISLDLKDVPGTSYEAALDGMRVVIHKAFLKHKYLSRSSNLADDAIEVFKDYAHRKNYKSLTESEIYTGLALLSEFLYIHFGVPVIILVDEYDTAINKAFRDPELSASEANKIVELHRVMFGSALKNNPYLDKALITGILRIAKASIFSGLNNFKEFSMGDKVFAGYYGFDQDEVDSLISQYKVPPELASGIRDWYNGYNVLGQLIYNPWSVVHSLAAYHHYKYIDDLDLLRQKVLQNYWQDSGNFSFVSPLFKHDSVKQDFLALSRGEAIKFDLKGQIDIEDFLELREMLSQSSTYKMTYSGKSILYSYLYAAGYLTPADKAGFFRAPNKEAQDILVAKLVVHYDVIYRVDVALYDKLTDQLQLLFDASSDVDHSKVSNDLGEALEAILVAMPEFAKMDRYNVKPISGEMVHGNESLVQVILTYASLRLKAYTQLATEVFLDKGRADLVVVDDKSKKAIIVELKYAKSDAGIALGQIEQKGYSKPIPDNYLKIHLGVNVEHDKVVDVAYYDIMPVDSQPLVVKDVTNNGDYAIEDSGELNPVEVTLAGLESSEDASNLP